MRNRLVLLAIAIAVVGCRRPPPPEPEEPELPLEQTTEEPETEVPEEDDGEDEEQPTGDGDCVPSPATEREPTAAESAQAFTDLGLQSYFGCAGCHASGSPDGSDMSWGPGGGTWHDASAALMEREPPGGAVESSSLYLHFTALNSAHPGMAGAPDAVLSWWAFRGSTVTEPGVTCDDGAPVVDDDDDDDVPVVCTPQPVSEAASRQRWNELSMDQKFSCAGCHNALGTPDGRNQEWGPGEADWWTAATTLLGAQAVLEAESTSLYLHFTPNFSRFHEDGTEGERTDTLAWILFHRSGPLPAGCE